MRSKKGYDKAQCLQTLSALFILQRCCYTLARLIKTKLKLEHGKKENKKLAGQLIH